MAVLNIKNFKCFRDVEIPLKPLTVMAGANGNGKSTSIQAILFLRKTIEELGNIFEGSYKVGSKHRGASIALNGGFLLALGNSSFILNRNSKDENILISIFNESNSIEAKYLVKTSLSDLFLNVESLTEYIAPLSPIFKKEFYYLNAERIGPRVSQNIQYLAYPHTGFQGEYVAQMIATLNYNVKIDKSRFHKTSKSPRLEAQINAWLGELMSGVSIVAVQSIETMTARIMVENYFTRGEPIIATNIGFGISYVLPILATGLIAEKGSYFIIENPEAHLHPSAQSKIGSFLAMVAASGVHVIVETHSDHVLNGIQLSVAKNEIDAGSVMINFFNQNETNTQPEIESIEINKGGELSKWPTGFFDQSQKDFAELFKIRRK